MSEHKLSVLVTGANGFVGRAVCAKLIERGLFVRGVVRGDSHHFWDGGEMPKNERLILGRNGRAYAEQEFGRKAQMDRLEGWLDEVSSSGRATGSGGCL